MKQYDEKIELYFDLKGTPDSSRESYWRRIRAFLSFMQNSNRSIEDIKEEDIQQYILFLKKEKLYLIHSIFLYLCIRKGVE